MDWYIYPRVQNDPQTHLSTVDRQPVGVDSALLLESALEGISDILHTERADRAARYAVRWGSEGAI